MLCKHLDSCCSGRSAGTGRLMSGNPPPPRWWFTCAALRMWLQHASRCAPSAQILTQFSDSSDTNATTLCKPDTAVHEGEHRPAKIA